MRETYDRMWSKEVIVQDEADRVVATKVVDIPFIFESCVSVADSRDKSVIVVSAECRVVHEPNKVGAVRSEGNLNSLSGGWGDKWDLAKRGGKAQGIVATVLELGGGPAGGSRWEAVGVCVFIIDYGGTLCRYTVRERTAWVSSVERIAHLCTHPVRVTGATNSFDL